jgi:uncharacterized protein (TIGR03086 family)
MDQFEALRRAGGEFAGRIRAVKDDQWHDPTPCPEWDVEELVRHGIRGSRMGAALVRGAGFKEFFAGYAEPESDLADAFDAAAADQEAAFAEPGALERTVEHAIGPIPGARLLAMRFCDLAIHAWDLAHATAGDEALDAGLLQAVFDSLKPVGPFLSASGFFGEGPSEAADDDSRPLLERVLDLSGRRPSPSR